MSNSETVIGIDLGTTNSVLAIIANGTPQLLPVQGSPLLPSVVGIGPQGDVLVGTPARNQWVVTPENTVRSIKRLIGSGERVSMAGSTYSPQEISAFILREIKQAAEQELGHSVQRAVITVPAYFNEVQRQATIEAGTIAGLVVERILNEPTAAALAYGFGMDDDTHLRVLVYDLGGGTFDVSIIEMNYGVVDVLSTAGDNHLGGDDFDERLAVLIADEFQEKHKIDLRQHHQAWARLLRAAEETKIALSSSPFATLNLEYITTDRKSKALHIQREVTRNEFVELIDDMLQRTIACIDQAMQDAKIEPQQIDRVLLVGGSTRIPAVWDLVARRMHQDPHIEIDPDAAVALGAAVQAAIIAGEEINSILVDVTPMSLGIETATFGFSGQLRADHYVPLIRRNTTIPAQKSEVFSTIYPSQKQIEVKVFQGEHALASQNVLLGEFLVEDLKPNRPDGLTDVTVSFQIDVNGILNVTVVERGTGKQVTEQLKADRQRLSPEQIAESQARMAAIYGDAEVGYLDEEGEALSMLDRTDLFDPGTHALLERARLALERPDLDEQLANDLRSTVEQIQLAAVAGDTDEVEQHCDELIDLLFDAEEA
jgi:molecular chaperone DnaK